MEKSNYEQEVLSIFNYVVKLFKLDGLKLKFMQRRLDEKGRGKLNLKKTYRLAYINLKTKEITLDIYTPKFRRPKSINSILRILAHEIAHIQKPPFRQRWQGRVIVRQHYPLFYRQVNKNIAQMKKDRILKLYFKNSFL